MIILRPEYQQQLNKHIHDPTIKLVLVHGGRGSGKTTFLKNLLNDVSIQQKKYYFSFEDQIVAKKFRDANDFKQYMQFKYHMDFHEPHLLLLNEIQYSKNIFKVLKELLEDPEGTSTIIASGILPIQEQDYQNLASKSQVASLTISALSFFEFLHYKGFHTDHLTITNHSSVVFKEIQGLLDEYLIRGGYPEVIKANHKERKELALKQLIQKVYDKDVGFVFQGEDSLAFQDLLEQLCRSSMQGFKYKTISLLADISIRLLKRYIIFLRDNNLIYTIPYFFSDKTQELSHQETLVLGDMGIMSYMTNNFSSKLNDSIALKTFVYNEISKCLPEGDSCLRYQKTNNSLIDFVVIHADGSYTPIVISLKHSIAIPKVFHGFEQIYGKKVNTYIKLNPLLAYQGEVREKPYICAPYFMISKLLCS